MSAIRLEQRAAWEVSAKHGDRALKVLVIAFVSAILLLQAQRYFLFSASWVSPRIVYLISGLEFFKHLSSFIRSTSV